MRLGRQSWHIRFLHPVMKRLNHKDPQASTVMRSYPLPLLSDRVKVVEFETAEARI